MRRCEACGLSAEETYRLGDLVLPHYQDEHGS
jgi:hypothetical protein